MLMKNFFVIFTLLLLALADLGSSAPQKKVPASPASPALKPFDIATLAASVDANNTLAAGDISKNCQDALNTIIQSDLMVCLPIDAILKLIGQKDLLAELIKDPLHNIPKLKPTFDNACSVTKCKDADVQKAATTVLTGCGAELAAKVEIVEAVFAGLVIYSPAIDIVCFKDHAANYCLFETGAILLSLPPPPKGIVIPGLEKAPPLLESVAIAAPSSICTPCNKAIINTFFDYYNKTQLFAQVLAQAVKYDSKANGFANLAVDVKCGLAPFNDGNVGDPSKGPDPPIPH